MPVIDHMNLSATVFASIVGSSSIVTFLIRWSFMTRIFVARSLPNEVDGGNFDMDFITISERNRSRTGLGFKNPFLYSLDILVRLQTS